jgi:hypothetical protein
MDDGDSLLSLCGSTAVQDLVLEDFEFDFDAFLNTDFSLIPDIPAGAQETQTLASPARKKKRSNSTTQPYRKKKSIKLNHVCDIHPPPTSARCFGKWSKIGPYKGARCDKTVATFVDGQLPVCTQHKVQVMKMTYCEAVLECGFPCNEIVPWKPHGYRLCEAHWSQGKCWFLALPVEARLMIYQYLIPDKLVPASHSNNRCLRADYTAVSTAIFRVNKTIHEEVADLFYGQTTFGIHVTNEPHRNVNSKPKIFMCCAEYDSLAVRDYQLQLMLLEQQNRARLRRARAATAAAATAAAAGETTTSRAILRKELAGTVKYDFTPWQPSLSSQYFQRIRSFHINVTFNTVGRSINASNGSQNAETILAEAERNLLCDYLHRLVDRLVLNNQIPLQKLTIGIHIQGILISDEAEANTKAIAHCQALVKPIRRLRTRAAGIVSLSRTGNRNGDINMLPESPKEEHSIDDFVRSCCAELTNLAEPTPNFPVLARFGQLTRLISSMSQHPFWRDTDIEEMEFFLDNGRSAREANDITAMLSILQDVLDMLKKFNRSHYIFMEQMKHTFEAIRADQKSDVGSTTPSMVSTS